MQTGCRRPGDRRNQVETVHTMGPLHVIEELADDPCDYMYQPGAGFRWAFLGVLVNSELCDNLRGNTVSNYMASLVPSFPLGHCPLSPPSLPRRIRLCLDASPKNFVYFSYIVL